MRRHPKRIWVDPNDPQPWGTSDANGMIGPRPKMSFQHEWRGNKIVKLTALVHPDELDIPNRQLGNLMLTPDPPPKRNSRPENYTIDEASYLSTEDGSALLTETTAGSSVGFQLRGFQAKSAGGFQAVPSVPSPGVSIIDAPITAEPGQ